MVASSEIDSYHLVDVYLTHCFRLDVVDAL